MFENRVILEKFFGGTGTSSSSRLTQDTPETPWNAHNNGRAKQPEDPGRPRYFITLAPSFSSTEDEDSSSSSASSVYDSIHNRETGTGSLILSATSLSKSLSSKCAFLSLSSQITLITLPFINSSFKVVTNFFIKTIHSAIHPSLSPYTMDHRDEYSKR